MPRLVLAITFFVCAATMQADPVLKPGGMVEFLVEMPQALREFAAGGRTSPVKTVRVAVVVPANFDPTRVWPIMVISATSDPEYNSSCVLLGQYAKAALATGWILLAADPQEKVGLAEDNLQLRYALASTGLSGLEQLWPGAAKAPLAFGGYSGGAKHSGWLAAEFAAQGRPAIGVFQGGINKETVALAGRRLNVLNDAYRRIPVYLQGGTKDEIATPEAHRAVAAALKRSGFVHVRLEFNEARHAIDTRQLQQALEWFGELAAHKASAASDGPDR